MLALRQVATEPRLFAVSVGGSALVVLLVGFVAGFSVALVLTAGLLVLGLLSVVRMIVLAEDAAADRLALAADGQARTVADLRDLGGRVRAVETAQRAVGDLRDHVDRLETVVSVLTRWPRDLVDAPVTTSAFFRPSTGDDARPPTSTRDELDRIERRRAAQERGRKRVSRWRTQLKSAPDRLAVYVDVFWLPGAATADGLPMLLLRRADRAFAVGSVRGGDREAVRRGALVAGRHVLECSGRRGPQPAGGPAGRRPRPLAGSGRRPPGGGPRR